VKRLFLLNAIFLIHTSVFAVDKYTISGRVIDKNNKAIPFASVMIDKDHTGAAADVDGRFELATTTTNDVVLLVTSVGYKEKRVEVLPEHMELPYIEIQLDEDALNLNEVMVRANGTSAQIERSGFSVASVDVEALASKSLELNEVLDQMPGLKVRRDGGLGSSTSYNINGLSGQAVRIFIDGVPMESFGSSYSVNSIPVSLIERVDVYKGVVPIELGNDAMGGAINIVTKKQGYNTLNASYSYGSFNTHRAAISSSMRNNKTGITAKASAFYNYSDNNYKVWSDDVIITDDVMYLEDGSINPEFGTIERGVEVERFHNAYRSYGVKASLGITDKAWADQLFFDVNLSKDYKEKQHGATMLTVYGERFTENWTVAPSLNYMKDDLFLKGLNLSANVQYSYGQTSLTDTSLNSYNWYGDIRPVVVDPPVAGESGTASLNTDDNSNYIARMGLSYDVTDDNTLSMTYSGNRFVRSSDDAMRTPEERAYGSISEVHKQILGFTYQNLAFDQRLRSSVFAKYYLNALAQDRVEMETDGLDTLSLDSEFSNWGYGFTTAFELSPKVQFSASAEKAVRLVSANEVFGSVSSNIVESLGLQPESSLNFNLGSKISPLSSNYHHLEISANFFVRNTKDKIQRVLVESADMDSYEHTNVGRMFSKGIELNADYNIAQKWNFSLMAYYLDSRFMDEYTTEGSIDLRYKSREPNMPYLTFGANVSRHLDHVFSTDDRISFSWYSSYVHEFFLYWELLGSQNKEIVPTQFINDASVAYTFPNKTFRLSLDGKNVFNALAFDNYAIQKPGRAFYIKLTYQM